MKQNVRKILLGAALGIIMASPVQISCSPAASTSQNTPGLERFIVMDTNHDGKVVLEEFQAALPNMNENAFVVIDKNKDNGIDEVEWEEFVRTHGAGGGNMPQRGVPMNNIPGDPLIPPPDSNDLPLVQPPVN